MRYLVCCLITIAAAATACSGPAANNVANDSANNAADNTANTNTAATANGSPAKPVANSEAANANTAEGNPEEFVGTAGVTDKRNIDISAPGVMSEVRTAGHENFDRVVFQFLGAELPGYHVEYIESPVTKCGSGETAVLLGDSYLEVRFTDSQAHTPEGDATIKERDRKPLLTTIKQLMITCDFEGETTWVLGIPEKRNYRVTELTNPTRLAVDIKHK